MIKNLMSNSPEVKSGNTKRLIIVLLLGLGFFYFCQFYSIYFRSCSREGPMGIDDCFFYISRIAYFSEYGLTDPGGIIESETSPHNYHDFNGLTYYYFLSTIGNLFNLNPYEVFRVSFYIGIFLLGIVFLLFFIKSKIPCLTIPIGFFLFSFFNGKGCYHGTYWVVPSFYAILLWLLLIWILFYLRKKWTYILPLIVLAFLFTHISSLFGIFVLVIALLLNGIFADSQNRLFFRKAAHLLSWFTVFFVLYNIFFYKIFNIYCFKEGYAAGTGVLSAVNEKFLGGVPFLAENLIFILISIIAIFVLLISMKSQFIDYILLTVIFLSSILQISYIFNSYWILFAVAVLLTAFVYILYLSKKRFLSFKNYYRLLKLIKKYRKSLLFVCWLIPSILIILIMMNINLNDISFFQISQTPYFYYFGPFLPVLASCLWQCWNMKKTRYLVSLFISVFFTCTIWSLLSPHSGRRTFLFLEFLIVIILSFGLSAILKKMYQNFFSMPLWKKAFFTFILLGSLGIISINLYRRLYLDFNYKFRSQAEFDIEKAADFIKSQKNDKKIVYAGEPIMSMILLTDSNTWDSNITFNSQIPALPKRELSDFSDEIIAAFYGKDGKWLEGIAEYRFTKEFPKPIIPENAYFVLKNLNLSPGKYKLRVSDTGMIPDELSKLKLIRNIKANLNRQKKIKPIISFGEIMLDGKKDYPAFLLPWYYVADLHQQKNKNFWTVRKYASAEYNLELKEKQSKIYFINDSSLPLFLYGNISIEKNGKQIFSLDLHENSELFIKNHCSLLWKNNETNLLWQFPDFVLNTKNYKSMIFMSLLSSCGDIKFFGIQNNFKNKN